jgi:hypothetical protein
MRPTLLRSLVALAFIPSAGCTDSLQTGQELGAMVDSSSVPADGSMPVDFSSSPPEDLADLGRDLAPRPDLRPASCMPLDRTTCPASLGCYVTDTGGGQCSTSGTVPNGRACNSQTDCERGAVCAGNDIDGYRCFSMCNAHGGAPSCATGACLGLSDSSDIGICQLACNPFDPRICIASEGCYLTNLGNVCAPAGTVPGGGSCVYANDCVGGFTCFNDQCHQVCNPAAGLAACSVGICLFPQGGVGVCMGPGAPPPDLSAQTHDLSAPAQDLSGPARDLSGDMGDLGGKRVFITSQVFNGNLGGLSGADAKCQAAADAAGLGGSYQAWLSDEDNSPATRFATHFSGPYVLVDGTRIADSWTDLITSTSFGQPPLQHAIDQTELGTSATATSVDCFGALGHAVRTAWTDTLPDGTAMHSFYHTNCAKWTSSAGNSASVGSPDTTHRYWWTQQCEYDNGPGAICGSTAALFCFEQ